MSPRLSSFFDFARWAAALLVVATHVRQLLLVDKVALPHLTLPLAMLYRVTGLGEEAVIAFFVMSGYLVGGQVVRTLREDRFRLRDYAAARISRIYVVLIPALLCGALCDLAGLRWADVGGVYSRHAPLGEGSLTIAGAIADYLNLKTLIGNLAMLETIVVERLGSNGPLWSLVNEWWYYVIFGCLAASLRSGAIAFRLSVALIAATCLFVLPLHITLWGCVWLLGTAAAVYAGTTLPRPPLWLGLLCCALAVGVERHMYALQPKMGMWPSFGCDMILAIGFSILSLAFATPGKPLAGARFHAWAANFSYSTYLTHFPFMLLCGSLAVKVLGLPFQGYPSAYAIAAMAAIVLLCLVYAFAFSRLTEAHTSLARNALLKLLRPLSKPPQLAPAASES